MFATINLIDFGSLATSLHGFAYLCSGLVGLLLPLVGLLFLAGERRLTADFAAMAAPVGEYRIARDGRAYLKIGRVCHFGRRGEDEGSLRARLAGRGVL